MDGKGLVRTETDRTIYICKLNMVITHFFALAFLDPFDHSASSTAAFFESSAAFLLAAASAFLACPAAFLLFSPAPPPFLAIFIGCVCSICVRISRYIYMRVLVPGLVWCVVGLGVASRLDDWTGICGFSS